MPSDTIHSVRLSLRSVQIEDAVRFTELVQSPEIPSNGLGMSYPYTLEEAQKMIQRAQDATDAGHMRWAIVHNESREIIGLMTFINNSTHHHCEIGYWIGNAYWNQGFATEAAKAVLAYAFEVRGMHRVIAQTFLHNPSSVRVLEKIGMRYEGEMRDHIWHDFTGEYKTLLVYGILDYEYADLKAKPNE